MPRLGEVKLKKHMCAKCGCGGAKCVPAMICKILLVVGGLNWGILGLGMLMGKMMEWNVVHMVLGSWPVVEGIVYLLVGIAAVMKLFGCRCKKCAAGCATCQAGGGMDQMNKSM
ncbi:MAG TPA: DUF378 domain-containing protein [Candidatus Paceibacterota bacterium]|nr:DUF378 domain-containing protein [Candidatus Paceibacterota bacterium]